MVIAVDGPSGVGKSTVSRSVAERLGMSYLDTGSTYRAATLAVVRAGIDIGSEDAVLGELETHNIDYSEAGILLDGEAVSLDIRSDEVTRSVSEVSAHPGVRADIVEIQREWVRRNGGDAVVEGRDIGTVVFPEALLKIYLTASPLVRAERRSGDPETVGMSIEAIAHGIKARDHADSTRETSPLHPALDAIIIDTSLLTLENVVERIVEEAEAL